jgi:hypothetical protein
MTLVSDSVSESPQYSNSAKPAAWRRIWPWAALAVASTAFLAGLDPRGRPFEAAGAYAILVSLGVAVLALVWSWMARRDAPMALRHAVFAAVCLRLVLGVGLARLLPVYGYDEEPQRKGYVFYDSFARDEDAWARARSSQPLLSAFLDRRPTDQYGGLLYLSAWIYRYVATDVHRPLTAVVPGAMASSLGVLFAWGFAALALGGKAALRTAWIVALYPEAALLASSQMREPYLITAFGAALFGYALARAGSLRTGVVTGAAGFLLALFFSPPTAASILGVILLLCLWEEWIPWTPTLRRLGRVALVGIALALVWMFVLPRLEGRLGVPARALMDWWEGIAGEWRVRMLAAQSDSVLMVFRGTPAWMHIPLAVVYGLVQPFLPATIVDPGLPLWRALGLFRSGGWFALLPFLLYAPLASWRATGPRSLITFLALLVWVAAVIASFRASGFLWDSPRYRAILLVAQAAVAAWAWRHAAAQKDPWLRRCAWLLGFATLAMLQWYVGRYLPIPHLEFPATIALVAAGTLGLIGFWLTADWRSRRAIPA